jgi:hypothetical protein
MQEPRSKVRLHFLQFATKSPRDDACMLQSPIPCKVTTRIPGHQNSWMPFPHGNVASILLVPSY